MFASLRNTPPELQHGIIYNTRKNKYGFIDNGTQSPIFFHFSELSDEDKALVEPGFRVSFYIEPNTNGVPGIKATNIKLIGTKSTYMDVEGVVATDMKTNGICSIESKKNTYMFFSHNLVNDDACRSSDNTVRSGQTVKFDIKMNYKYNPPRPCAVNVRIVIADNNTSFISRAHTPGLTKLSNTRALALHKGPPVHRWTRDPIPGHANVKCGTANKYRSRDTSTASLRVMLNAIVRDCDHSPPYETIRNHIQSEAFLNRKLSMEEKRRLSVIFNNRPVVSCTNIVHNRGRCAF